MTWGIVKKPYFLLEQPERMDDDILNSLLGLAVQDPYKPLSVAFRPREPLQAREAIDRLYPSTYVVCTDFTKVEKKAKKGKATSKFQRIASLSLEKGSSNTDRLEAAVFRRIGMLNARTKIEDLLRKDSFENNNEPPTSPAADSSQGATEQRTNVEHGDEPVTQDTAESPLGKRIRGLIAQLIPGANPATPTPDPEAKEADRKGKEAERKAGEAKRKAEQQRNRIQYRDQVLDLLRRQKKLYVITSFITCSDFIKNKERIDNKFIDAAGGTGPAGLPAYVEVNLRATYESTDDAGTSGAYQGEYLIGCSYLPLYLAPKNRSQGYHFYGCKIVPVNASHDTELYIGTEEIWRLGDGEEGNMSVTLGQNRSSDTQREQEADSGDLWSEVSLVYREDETSENPHAPDNSEDEISSEDETEVAT